MLYNKTERDGIVSGIHSNSFKNKKQKILSQRQITKAI